MVSRLGVLILRVYTVIRFPYLFVLKFEYHIRPNYSTCSYKCTVKQCCHLKDYNQCTFTYFFIKKKYFVGTHLNCLDKSRQFKRVPTTYASIKKTENNIA